MFLLTVNKTVSAIFIEEKTLVVSGEHSEHTTGADGSFEHPFLTSESSIEAIHYPDTKTFSLKLATEFGLSKFDSLGASSPVIQES